MRTLTHAQATSSGAVVAPRNVRRAGRSLPVMRSHPMVNAAAVVTAPPQTQTATKTAAAPVVAPAAAPKVLDFKQQMSLIQRHKNITQYFPSALGVDDFMARVEVALSGFGFTGDNSIAITNLCRDEVTIPLKDKIEAVFGSSFNTNGLGGVLTCGVTGMGAGFSHSPISNGKEHYVFFAFPHIAINSAGEVGAITRPGRPNKSCACGALQKCLIELKAEGYSKSCKVPGVHNPYDPEYSILKQRLARRVRFEGLNPTDMSLVDLTHVAERTITGDLEYLIEKAVDPKKANYAIVTGVQIHNWCSELSPEGVPNLEFVAPARVAVVVDGVRHYINLKKVPTMSPRQLQLLARASMTDEARDMDVLVGRTSSGTLKEIPFKYLTQRLGVTKDPEVLEEQEEQLAPEQGWQAGIIATMAGSERDPAAPTMDSDEKYSSFNLLGGLGGLLGVGNNSNVPWPPSV